MSEYIEMLGYLAVLIIAIVASLFMARHVLHLQDESEEEL